MPGGAEYQGNKAVMPDPSVTYRVGRSGTPPPPDAQWDKPFWRHTPALDIRHAMGDPPQHRPVTQARLAYDDLALYLIFRVADRFVRVAHKHPQAPVCEDSCVEFFFTPGTRLADGYFNLEVNAGGTAYFSHRQSRKIAVREIAAADLQQVRIAHSLTADASEERPDPIVWTIEYAIPFSMLATYAPVDIPASGTRWRANFYKCADQSSHPHWLTWATIDNPYPDFHRPEFFGTLLFV